MRKPIEMLANFLRTQKKFIFMSFVFALILFVSFFPYGDMSDYVVSQVAEKTGNQVILQFDDMKVGFLPPSVVFENVQVNNPIFAPLKASELSLAPALASFLAFSPGLNISSEGLWQGDFDAQVKQSKIKDSKAPAFELKASAENIELQQVSKFFALPVQLLGKLSLDISPILVDSSFRKQPETKAKGTASGFEIETGKVTLPKTRIQWFDIPQVQISSLQGTGRLNPGSLIISELLIGSPGKGDLNGKINGKVDMKFSQMGGRVQMIPSAANFKIDLRIESKMYANLKPFLSLAEKYKASSGGPNRYLLQVTGSFQRGRFVPGNITPIRAF